MTQNASRSVVTVYSSPSAEETQLVRSLLAAEGIHASATEVNSPFPGLPITASSVVVWAEDEARARELIEAAALHHQKHS